MSPVGFRRLDLNKVRTEIERYAADVGRREPDVQRVSLFGSLATGNATGSSDADLLIVVDHSEEPFHQRTGRFMTAELPVPVDVFVYTLAELDEAVTEGRGFLYEALASSRTLYVRPTPATIGAPLGR
ncbi:MAG TPA: nucleotidyltransferase domain-containing protein [Limnochordia bacterium]|nr:nucleotidyltransferase domain-containing protein [Limnochordia bacterium]